MESYNDYNERIFDDMHDKDESLGSKFNQNHQPRNSYLNNEDDYDYALGT